MNKDSVVELKLIVRKAPSTPTTTAHKLKLKLDAWHNSDKTERKKEIDCLEFHYLLYEILFVVL